MKNFLKYILLASFCLGFLSCDNDSPETMEEFLTFRVWRPFQLEAPDATQDQITNYQNLLAEMRISYMEDGTYTIDFINDLATDQSGTWSLRDTDSTLTMDAGSSIEKVLKVEDIQSISFVYATTDSIGAVRVFCVAE
ncbi:MAG: hypothetical protein MRZ79_20220 [Bacteroidia bacterium]|nr:hypothetical protein [Bacteroidia bacterium]